ncbi:protein translocase subunit SecD [Halanaerobacter jeridensis]|uniref:Protein translocase subunit SecD n=1 Tax=Halanaerobacter jeridensis TaxID=706427 RepID=A0A938XRF0_9FIRM|nr:protein translocase subunit SecD [Halanaerobacter jeridensis]MBM7556276.1 preprotein translocase subunit SecD [Halanaerobacter jeridensis]
MTWKQKRVLKLASIVVLLLVAAYFLYPLNESINLGLDLQGGTHVVLEAQDTAKTKVNNEAMQRVKSVIKRRVNGMGLTEPVIQLQGERRIIVELPGIENPNEAIQTIGRTAQLKFKNEADEVLMTGDKVKDAESGFDSKFNRPIVVMELTSEGQSKFAEITRNNVGRRVGIYLDNELLTNPQVQEEINRSKARITGFESIQEAQNIALQIRSGALPVPVEVIENRTVGPILGEISINKSVKAGIIGLILIVIFMTLTYRLPGVLAAIALAFYSIIVLGVLSGLNATLTLPGIAGLILSIGMAVDANVIIFERIKYEYQQGKTLKASVESGFQRAFHTILDSNVTTLITVLVLAYFGTGTIKGFAITLGIGILTSMFTAIIVTRMLLNTALDTNLLQKNSLLGWSRR